MEAEKQLKEPISRKSCPRSGGGNISFVDNRPQVVSQAKLIDSIQRRENRTGLPDNLKTGIENLSGFSMDDVRVHYNSDKPAQLQALAYTQGTDIHVGPGQEKHLPHEAWHIVQQMQGRVKSTAQMKGVNVNGDVRLEKEADICGSSSLLINKARENITNWKISKNTVLQAKWLDSGKENLVWDQVTDGLRWSFNIPNNMLFFSIEVDHRLPRELVDRIKSLENRAMTRDQWLLTGLFTEGTWTSEDALITPMFIKKDGKEWLTVFGNEIKEVEKKMHTEYKNKIKRYSIPKDEWDKICDILKQILEKEPTVLGGAECMKLIDEFLAPLEEKYLKDESGHHAFFSTSRNFLAEICVGKSYWLAQGTLLPWIKKEGDTGKTPDYEYTPDPTLRGYADTFIVQPNNKITEINNIILSKVKDKINKYQKSDHLPFTVIINITLVSQSINKNELIAALINNYSLTSEKIGIELLDGDEIIKVKSIANSL